ncbi:hypothetical protein OE88DRAFT_1535543 [Heliocybe sulcata]|uniref:Uncharacterized protein n=1 Tax=Heliocybe sulcata TaxID=5364 RepID=A0A5C3N138_9AGAM|nr:hypothetical protein OE88DRAFT_1535543 [Heliocybe sulcata]
MVTAAGSTHFVVRLGHNPWRRPVVGSETLLHCRAMGDIRGIRCVEGARCRRCIVLRLRYQPYRWHHCLIAADQLPSYAILLVTTYCLRRHRSFQKSVHVIPEGSILTLDFIDNIVRLEGQLR